MTPLKFGQIVMMSRASFISRSVHRTVWSINTRLICKRLFKCDPIQSYAQTRKYSKFSLSGNVLSKKEAIQFLQNSWKMNEVELELQTNRESFLNKLILAAHENIPFLYAFPEKYEFPMPTWDEIYKTGMFGEGGYCFKINMFMWCLVKALGYSAHPCLVSGTTTARQPHTIVIIKDLVHHGDIQILDCGLGGPPCFQAISLDFKEESPVYHDSFLEYKFIKHDGKILRMHGYGELFKRNNPPIPGFDFILGRWRRYFELSLHNFEQRTIRDIDYYFNIYKEWVPKRIAPRAVRFPGGKAVMIVRAYDLLVEQEDRTLKKTKLKSDKEVFDAFMKYFPSIDINLVQRAYFRWQKDVI